MLWVLIYLIVVAAWIGNCVCKGMEDRTMIDVIGIFILCLFWPIILIGVMLSDFCKGAKNDMSKM